MAIAEDDQKEKQLALEGAAIGTRQPETEVQPGAEPAHAEIVEAQGSEPVKHARKRRKAFWRLILLLIAGLAAAGYLQRERALRLFLAGNANGTAPAGEHSGAARKPELKVLYWADPMHPAYKSDKPGQAPDCGMDLVPVYEEGSAASETASLPAGAFRISPEKQQLIGVQYGEASYQSVSKTLRAVGRIAYDETKIARIHTKVEGWIENVYADFTGKLIKKGEPLISIYSPDLLQTQLEYLLAVKGRKELGESPFREAAAGSESLYQSARKRLELWDVTDEQINEIEKRGTTIKTMTLYAPVDGFITARNAYPKQRVMPDTELYAIADLSTVWVMADIYEFEAPEIKIGQAANVTLSYFPGRTFKGKVSYIYPLLDNATRTMKARVEIPNVDFMLKPDMYANVELKIDYGKHVVVPQEAVMDSGSEQIVFVALKDGYFEPRKVQIGAKADGRFIVLNGLKAGERVATSANFLIDSESRLKSAAAGMGLGHGGHGGGAPSSGKASPQAERQQPASGAQSPEGPKAQDHSKHR